ncbi:hypothetical protein K1T71_012448 [Dendrolimus kikuchii]|uniref:Uncharacterized protein n=1 Tax=Dendrolimus kikuchii TaxID=765133 RepID=A0ACC1CJJ4_9NEOP|nr:hypothetical protein K1T71_012448 [Dendrolimus kikuchii]
MENYADIYKTICRVCLKINTSEKLERLIDDRDSTGLSCFGKAIPTFARVSYKKDDKLPQNVCQKCIYLLKQAIYFKFTCESSEKWLKNVLEHSLINNLTDTKIQENVCQYIMYRHYFPARNDSNSTETSENCLSANKTVSERPDANKTGMTCKNKEKNNKKIISRYSNLLQDCENDLSDFDDNCSNSLEENTIKSISTLLPANKKRKKLKEDKELLINTMKSIAEMKVIKMRPQRGLKQRNIPCEICNKVLANQVTYNSHMQRHNTCRYVCDKCAKGFPVLAELHIHQISKHGIGPYLPCEHCSYKAPTKLKLKEHIRLHTGERPFTCDKCGLTFRRQAIWRNHQYLHMEKQVQCKICPQKFYRNYHMLAHMNNVHERKYLYMCSVCDVTYAKIGTVRRHMITKHGIKRELQGKIKRVDQSLNSLQEKEKSAFRMC